MLFALPGLLSSSATDPPAPHPHGASTGAPPRQPDPSELPPLGAYVARRCPVVAHNDHDLTVDDGLQVDPPEVGLLRMEAGNQFEAAVFDELERLHGSALVTVDEQEPEPRRRVTLEAMDAGTRLICGGELPLDLAGARVGKPDVLLRAGEHPRPDGRWGYRALDVKHHQVIDAKKTEPALRRAALSVPWVELAGSDEGRTFSRDHRDDWLQLAHYQRMLEACGREAPDGCWAALIGSEREVVWLELAEQELWQPWDEGRRRRSSRESTLARYDFEFDFRLRVVDTARRQPGCEGPPPVKISECDECRWRAYCVPRLEAADDVSLLPGIAWREWKLHADRGVRSRLELARLDARTAQVIDQGVDVAGLLAGAADAPPEAPVAELVAPAQAAKLEAAGIARAADAARLCPATARYSLATVSLGTHIDLARAAKAGQPFLRRRIDELTVPRGDIEVDLDMESTPDGEVYLWGTLVTNRSSRPELAAEGYRAYVTFEPLGEPPSEEGRVLAELWTWLAALRAAAERAGLVLRAYCYTPIEATKLRSVAERHAGHPGVPLPSELEALFGSDAWVDLHTVVKDQLVTGRSLALKEVAPLASFSWRDEEAGGDNSMLWYREAVGDPDPDRRRAARRRLLTYNEDDVTATLRLRDWLDHEARALPNIAELDRSWPKHRPARARRFSPGADH